MTSIKKTTSLLFVLRLFRLSLSMVTLIFSAKFFGVTVERDMWILATTVLTTICSAVWGPINETFRAKFVFIREQEGEEIALRKTTSLLLFIVGVTLGISLITWIGKNGIASLIVQQSTQESLHLFVALLLVMLPSLLINELINIGISILNAYEVYYVPEIVGTVSSFLNIFIIVLLAPVIDIYALAVSQYISLVILLVVIIFKIYTLKIFRRKAFACFHFKHVKVFILFALPFFFPYFVGQCNFLTEKWLAGFLGTGNVSSLDYARQFTSVLQGVLSSILTTVMVPMLAVSYARKEKTNFIRIVNENLVVCFAILALAVPMLFGAARPICEFFFLRGKVSVEALELIIILTRMYAIAFIGILLYLIFGFVLLSSDKGKYYALWGVLTQLLVLGINWALVFITGIYVFPISLGCVHFIAALMMSLLLERDIRINFYKHIAQYIAVVIVLCCALYAFDGILENSIPFVGILCHIVYLMLLFLFASKWLDLDVRSYINRFLQKFR